MRILTKEQFKQIAGKEYSKDLYFNPILDSDADIVISEEEAEQCDNEFLWVKDLPKKDFEPIIINTSLK
jgi:hypothetical protein